MKHSVVIIVCTLLCGCVVSSSKLTWTNRHVAIGDEEHLVRWTTYEDFAPDLEFGPRPGGSLRDVPEWNRSIGWFVPPSGQFFVPIYCDLMPSFADFGDADEGDGLVFHVDGFARVLTPFSKRDVESSSIVVTGAPRWVMPMEFGEPREAQRAWREFSIYLLGIPDSLDNRRSAAQAGSLEEILSLTESVLEIRTKQMLRISKEEQVQAKMKEAEASLQRELRDSIPLNSPSAHVRRVLVEKFRVAPKKIQRMTMESPWANSSGGRERLITHTFLVKYRKWRPNWFDDERGELWIEIFFDANDESVDFNVEVVE